MLPRLLLPLAITITGTGQAGADQRLIALGRHLSQECATCHKAGGGAANIPPLAGLEADYLVETIGFYKSGTRNNPAMVSVALSLDGGRALRQELFEARTLEGVRGLLENDRHSDRRFVSQAAGLCD